MSEKQIVGTALTPLTKVEVGGICYDLADVDVENYGPATFALNPMVESGEYRRINSMIPSLYIDKMGKDFEWTIYHADVSQAKKTANGFILSFKRYRERGKGLYICSKQKGSGKTLLSCCLANEISERYSLNIKFIVAQDFVEMIKKGNKEEKDVIFNASMLIFDDLGTEGKKDWIEQAIFNLVNYRYNHKLITIYTSNIELDSLKTDSRTIDRIMDSSIPLFLPEESIRSRMAEQKNKKFLDSLLYT